MKPTLRMIVTLALATSVAHAQGNLTPPVVYGVTSGGGLVKGGTLQTPTFGIRRDCATNGLISWDGAQWICSTAVTLGLTTGVGTVNRLTKWSTTTGGLTDSSITDNGAGFITTPSIFHDSNTVEVTVGSGVAGLVVETTAKSWTWYPSGTDLRLFEYSTTYTIGGGNDRAIWTAGGKLTIPNVDNLSVPLELDGAGGETDLKLVNSATGGHSFLVGSSSGGYLQIYDLTAGGFAMTTSKVITEISGETVFGGGTYGTSSTNGIHAFFSSNIGSIRSVQPGVSYRELDVDGASLKLNTVTGGPTEVGGTTLLDAETVVAGGSIGGMSTNGLHFGFNANVGFISSTQPGTSNRELQIDGSLLKLNVNSGGATTVGGTLTVTGNLARFNATGDDPYILNNTINASYSTNASSTLWLNYAGYLGVSTQFRDMKVMDGKAVQICAFTGSNHTLDCTAITVGGTSVSTLTNSAGNNVIPKSNGTNLVASSVSDNGVTVSTSEAVSIGGLTVAGTIGATIPASQTASIGVNINDTSTGQTADEAAALYVHSNGSFDATAATRSNTTAVFEANASRSTGSFAVTNIGATFNAAGAQTNVALKTLNGDVVLNAGSGTLTATAGINVNSQKITNCANGTVSTDGACFGQIGSAVNAAVSGTSGRVAVFNGPNSVTGYAGFTSDTSGNISTGTINAGANTITGGQFHSTTVSGAASFATDTGSKSWAWYPSGTGLRLFEYTTTIGAGGGNDRVLISAGGATEFVGATTLDSTLAVTGLSTLTGGFSAGAQSDMTSHKIVNLTNGASAQDAAAFGQIGSAVNAAVSGTTNTLTMFTGTNTVGNSPLAYDGSTFLETNKELWSGWSVNSTGAGIAVGAGISSTTGTDNGFDIVTGGGIAWRSKLSTGGTLAGYVGAGTNAGNTNQWLSVDGSGNVTLPKALTVSGATTINNTLTIASTNNALNFDAVNGTSYAGLTSSGVLNHNGTNTDLASYSNAAGTDVRIYSSPTGGGTPTIGLDIGPAQVTLGKTGGTAGTTIQAGGAGGQLLFKSLWGTTFDSTETYFEIYDGALNATHNGPGIAFYLNGAAIVGGLIKVDQQSTGADPGVDMVLGAHASGASNVAENLRLLGAGGIQVTGTTTLGGATTINAAGSGPGLNISDATQLTERIRLSGQEYLAAAHTSTDGQAILQWTNRANDRRIALVDTSLETQNSTNIALTMGAFGTDSGTIDAMSTDGTTAKTLKLQMISNGTTDIGGALIMVSNVIDMNSHRINNVTDPSSAQDAATKNYVDTKAGLLIGIQRFAASGTYTPTSGTKKVWLRMCGAGGGGGGAKGGSSLAGVGAGGAAGAYVEKYIDCAGSCTGSTITDGTAGAGGATTPAAGGAGGDTTAIVNGVTYTAKGGGGGGTSGTGISSGFALGGAPVAGSTSADITSDSMENGQDGVVLSGTVLASGAGGSSNYGAGGKGSVNGSSAGFGAQGFCAGGGGAVANTVTGQVGGAGTAGYVEVFEYR